MQLSPFTEDHEHLRATLRRYVEAELAPHAREWEEAGRFPDQVFRDLGAMGMLGLNVPPEYGGAGADYWATVVMAEELGGSLTGSIPMAIGAHTDMAMPPILKFGTEEQKHAYLTPAVAGEKIAAIGITEPGAGSDVAAITTHARRDGSDWILNGQKTYITNGTRADFVTMVVRTDDRVANDPWGGISLFIVDTDLPGFEVARALDKVGMRSSDTAELFFTDVRLPAEALLGTEGAGFKQIMWELQGERLISACSATAGAQRNLDRAVTYAREREAFGRSILGFQALRHRLVDCATEIEAVRNLVYDCADKWNRGIYATTEIAMCKLAAATLGWRVADEVLQVHAGFGYSEESDVARAWRDARLMRIGGGTDEVQREIISKLMGL